MQPRTKNKSKTISPWTTMIPATVVWLLLLLVSPLMYTTDLMDAALLPRQMALAISLLLGSMLWFGLPTKMRERTFGLAPLNPILISLGLLASWVMASVFYAVNTAEALNEGIKQFMLLAALVLMLTLLEGRREGIIIMVKIILVTALLSALSGVVQYFLYLPDLELTADNLYRITGLFAHRNLYSEFLFLCLPFCIYGALFLPGGWQRLALFTTVFILILNILLMARSVWVALFAGFLAALLLVLMNRSQFMMYRQLLNRIIRLVWMGLGAALIAAVLYGSLFSFDAFRERFQEMTQRQYGTTHSRMILWEGSMDLVRSHPIAGIGSGNWKVWIPSTGIHDELEARSNTRIQRPHNDFLWIWTENGSIGLLLFLLFVVLLFRQGLKSLRHAAHPHDKWLIVLLLAGITGYLTISVFSFPRERIEHSLLFMAMTAVIMQHPTTPGQRTSRNLLLSNRIGMPLILLSGLIGIVITLQRIRGEREMKAAYTYIQNADHAGVIRTVDKAVSSFYTLDLFSTPLEWYKGVANYQTGNTGEAERSFRNALADNPYHGHLITSMAILDEERGDTLSAIEKYKEALTYNARYRTARLRLIYLYLNKGEYAGALHQLTYLKPIKTDRYYDTYVFRAMKGRMNQILQALNEPDLLVAPYPADSAWLRGMYSAARWAGKPPELIALDDMLLKMGIDTTGTHQQWRMQLMQKANQFLQGEESILREENR